MLLIGRPGLCEGRANGQKYQRVVALLDAQTAQMQAEKAQQWSSTQKAQAFRCLGFFASVC